MVINKNSKTSRVESKILARFSGAITAKKKNITFNINEELLERLDTVAAKFNDNDGTTTRTDIIEDAITSFVETAEDFFEAQDLVVDQDISSYVIPDYDTAVFPATNDNFSGIFIADREWRHVRVAESRRNNIKYIALYRGAPVSAITHYAEVVDVSDQILEKDNKRVIKVKEPVLLPNPVGLGSITVQSVRKLFYTKLETLKAVKTVEELLRKK